MVEMRDTVGDMGGPGSSLWRCVFVLLLLSAVLAHAKNSNESGDDQQNVGIPQSEFLLKPQHKRSTVQPQHVELVLVYDYAAFKEVDGDVTKLHCHAKDTVHLASSLFVPLNVVISLTDVVVWSERDEIDTSANYLNVLIQFGSYRGEHLLNERQHDMAHMFTTMTFNHNKDFFFKNSMCSDTESVGVSASKLDKGLDARTLAHTIGRQLDMGIDGATCVCPGKHCLMNNKYDDYKMASSWSNCSISAWNSVMNDESKFTCIRNKPQQSFKGRTSGCASLEMDSLVTLGAGFVGSPSSSSSINSGVPAICQEDGDEKIIRTSLITVIVVLLIACVGLIVDRKRLSRKSGNHKPEAKVEESVALENIKSTSKVDV